MKLGIVGLPNVGKSTLFNAITNAGVPADNYAFCTIDPNVGVVSVPDERLDWLAEFYQPKKHTPAVIEFVDIAGLVKGASKGEGLGNKFLSNIRTTDAIVHVVRCFEDSNVTHVEGSTDPLRDIDIINLELVMADMEMVERRIDKCQKAAKGGDKRFVEINTPEENRHYMAVKALAEAEGSQLLPICAKLEADIAELDDPEEKAMFMEELGVAESGLDRLIKSSYALLGLISFLTAGSDECRAWTIKKGTKAPQAAGKIHTDFERGFIRAEVIAFEDMKDCGTMAAAKAKGLVRSEGKEYVMKDGDIVNFLFNV